MVVDKSALKIFLNIPTADTGQDTLITALAATACGIMENYLGRVIEAADYTEEKHDGGDEMIIVKHRPLNSVSALTDYLSTVASTSYTFYTDSGIVQLYSGHFTARPNGVLITYNGGFETVPSAITEATLQIGAMLYKESDAGEGRLGKVSIAAPQGAGTLAFIRKLDPMLLKALDRYIEVNV